MKNWFLGHLFLRMSFSKNKFSPKADPARRLVLLFLRKYTYFINKSSYFVKNIENRLKQWFFKKGVFSKKVPKGFERRLVLVGEAAASPTHIYIYIYILGGGDTRDIAEPTYKTFNLPTRLSTYLQDKNTTAYKTFNLPTRLSTNYYTKTRPHTRLSTNLQELKPKY